jgi:WD40 repeat protein/serine/threonine protein kinase/tetratricopeptide (TPR) repeat protein
MTISSSDQQNPVELLAAEFLARKRRGEEPALGEYLERHPELADEIRELFPVLVMVEDLGESPGGSTGSLAGAVGPVVGTDLERLGDYRILREIGRGGMGVVYQAEQESLGRRVALKVMSAGALLDPNQVRRFEREARAAARLHHTNIVPVFGVGHEGGHHYFVMQFIAGLGLDQVLEDLRRLRRPESEAKPAMKPAPAPSRMVAPTAATVARSLITGQFAVDRPIPLGETVTNPVGAENGNAPQAVAREEGPGLDSSPVILPGSSELSASSDPDRHFYRSVARIGVQVAEALEYANRQGVLHRDVKPSNLLLDGQGNVWVADFGLAKTAEADDLTHTGDILGTIRYMAPERFQGKCDARSDVYSLGLTLYELVAQRPAYEGSDRHALMERVLHEEPQRLKKLAPSVPRDLETIIAKASAREPAGRYATAAALAEDLKRFVEDRPIRARRVSAAERLARWCRRNPWLAGSMAVAAAALTVALVVSLLYADRQARYAANLAAANTQIRTALSESNRRLAMLNFERGQTAFEKGHVGEGMLWTVASLRMAAEASADDWKHAALANLGAWRRQLPELKQIFPHEQNVYAVAFSRDGKTIVTATNSKTARLWNAATGQPIGQPIEHPDEVVSVAFGPDGKTLLTSSRDGTARLWHAATGRPIGQPLPHPNIVMSVAYSPDGKVLLTGCMDGTVRQWDAATGRPIGPVIAHALQVSAVAFSPDGRSILTGSHDTTARLWNAATGRQIGQTMQHPGFVWAAAFSPDGKTVLAGSHDGTARLWDAATGRPIGQPLQHSNEVRTVAFSPDGRTVLTGSRDKTVQLWDAATGERLATTLEHPGEVYAAAFSPDGRSILTGGYDKTVRLWTVEPGQPVGRLLDDGANSSSIPMCSPDGQTILVADRSGKVMLWDIASGLPVGRPVKLGSGVLHAAWSPDGQSILTGGVDGTARRWDVATGLPIGPPLLHPGMVTHVAFGLYGRSILTIGRDPKARVWEDRLWDAATGLPIGQPIPHSGWVGFSPDGRTLITPCDDTAARWDAATGQPMAPPLRHPGAVWKAACSPDGQTILTAGSDPVVRVWDGATGQPIEPTLSHQDRVFCMEFSPDGRAIVTGCADSMARVWDAATGLPIGPPLAHPGWVYSVAFSPDGKLILTGCRDRRARLWDAATGRQIGQAMDYTGYVGWVAFSPDGRFMLTHNYANTGWSWDVPTGRLWDAPAPLPEDAPRLAAWVEAVTGLELDEQGSVRVLDRDAWRERHRRLAQLGGPPPADQATRIDPMLFGKEPAARADAFAERGLWLEAEAAYLEAVRARPLDASWRTNSAWAALTRFYIARGRPEHAVAELGAAVSRWPDVLGLRVWHCLALLAAGDRVGWEWAIAGLLDRFRAPMHPAWEDAYLVAWVCAQGPYPLTDPKVPVRLAEEAIKNAAEIGFDFKRHGFSHGLGAAMYRAGRYDEAIRQVQEGIRTEGWSDAASHAFLSMAHHRLGHREEALRWLDRLRQDPPSTDRTRFWWEVSVRLLRSEAEAVVAYDPAFPVDPFAR